MEMSAAAGALQRMMSADENSVSLVKAALAALCIFRTRKKTQCLCVSVFKINTCEK